MVRELKGFLQDIPRQWKGKDAILEMKNNNYNQWKQMEWIGFYFQFLCEKYLKNVEGMRIPGPQYGRTSFDAFWNIPWDFKAHAINTSAHQVIVNDREAIEEGIKKYGKVGLILSLGEVEYNDENRSFQQWHEELKGGPSKYSLEREKRGAWSRLRKVSFSLEQIVFIEITNEILQECGSFQQDFRNSNGNSRKSKVLLDLESIDIGEEYCLEFKKEIS